MGAYGPQNRNLHLQLIGGWNATFSDTHFQVEEHIAEGDTVATRVTFRAVHSRGEIQGLAPTGKQIEVGGVTIERIQNGKIVERRVHLDWLWIMQQLGLVPLPQLAHR
jgi:predicted ester cyclase